MPRKQTLIPSAIALVAITALTIPSVTPAHAASSVAADVRAHVLVLDDGTPNVETLRNRMHVEGIPHTRIDLNSASRTAITASMLAKVDASGAHAQYSGVVVPNGDLTQLSNAERSILADYENTFKVREVVAYTWANPGVGLNYAANPGYMGPVDGMTATVSPDGLSDAFSYLRGSFTLDDISPEIAESFGYLATPATATATESFTPLISTPIPNASAQGSLVGVHKINQRERMIITMSLNRYQAHSMIMSHGMLNWLTRGVSTSYSRNFLSVHIDDVLLPDALWNEEGNCTYGDDCDPQRYPESGPGTEARMVPSDVTKLIEWQKQSGIKLDMVYNGFGATEQRAEAGSDALEAALLRNKNQFRWINHTWSHPYIGCEQDFSTTPWTCKKDSNGNIIYASLSTVYDEIIKNKIYATNNRLPYYSGTELVTGEHSGLKSAPQMAVDNPNLVSAVTMNAIKWIASDASREPQVRKIGSANTVPRYPTNIYYNTATKSQATDEYNWIYTSAANGGSGNCDKLTQIMTCITPLDTTSGFDSYIVPIESRIMLSHVMANDPRPHFAHQANLTQDRVLYPVLDSVLAKYRSVYSSNTPLVNPRMSAAGQELLDQNAWAGQSSKVTMTIKGNAVTVRNSGSTTVSIPVTLPTGSTQKSGLRSVAFGSAYAGQISGRTSVTAWLSKSFTLPTEAGFATSVSWSDQGSQSAKSATPAITAPAQNPVQPEADVAKIADPPALPVDIAPQPRSAATPETVAQK